MSQPRLWVTVLTFTGIGCGIWIAYRWPGSPLLAYWLLLAVLLGLVVSLFSSIGEVERRLRWLVWIHAFLIAASLTTTQIAARRAISSTHLVYRGVHLVGIDSFTVGSEGSGADVRLERISSIQLPWSLRVGRVADGWRLEPLTGIEQLRVRERSTRPIEHEFTVARSAFLQTGHDVQIIDPNGRVADKVRLLRDGLELESGATLSFDPADDRLRTRYQRRLARGTSLATLDGTRSDMPVVHERFVRIQEVSSREAVNGNSIPWFARLYAPKRYLISAAPPYTLRGDAVSESNVIVRDASFVEVRNGDVSWRFVMSPDWRRLPGAQRGVAILFNRNPKPLDTPLPMGISCEVGAACGAISMRRLPPPVAHVALDSAGFDPERYGLLGRVRLAADGYEVVLPRETYYIQRGAARPVAVPVAPLEPNARDKALDARNGESRWLLLDAIGDRDNVLNVVLIGTGLALLLYSVQAAMVTVTIRDSSQLTIAQGRAIAVGLTALLGLILTRVTVGARVAFFDPFLDRGIETAVGLCVAIAIVIVGLLAWSAWLPPFMAAAHSAFGGQLTLRRIGRSALQCIASWQRITPQVAKTAGAAALSIGLLTWVTRSAPWQGLLTGTVVLLVWVCLAWVAAFSGRQFDTFEGGAHSIVEQSSPPSSADAARPFVGQIPELSVVFAFLGLTLMHSLPLIGLIVATMTIVVAAGICVRRRRRPRTRQPDYVAALLGVAGFGACLAGLRMGSENGSLGALVLVVFAALASVRIGRGIEARTEVRARLGVTTIWSEWLLDAFLLATPLVLLAPLATIDMGLALVLVIPLAFATILATGLRTAGLRLIVPAALMLVLVLLGWQVVFPSMGPIRDADSHAAQAQAFARMSTLGGLRLPIIATPMDRAAARAVATYDQRLAESVLVAAAPGAARDLLVPSIEQVWGAKAYARAGGWGEGFGRATIGGRGVAEAVSYAENTFAVFVLAEHGAVGGLLVLCLYALLTLAVGWFSLTRTNGTPSYRASRALFLTAAMIVSVPACYVALSNLGRVPITGQNMPFLGLNAWSDVAICSGVVGILITGTLRALQEADR